MTLLPPTDAQLKAAAERRAILEAQRLAYMARDRGPGPSSERQSEGIEGAAKVAPKPLAAALDRVLEAARRRAAVREAGRRPVERIPEPVASGPMLKVYPSLAQRAMLLKRDRELRLWAIARSLPDAGSGRVKIVDIEALIEREDIGGLSPGTLRRLLNIGAGTFWTIGHDASGAKTLYLAGLAAVCEALGVTRLSHCPVVVDLRWVRTLAGFRAAIYASSFPASDWSNPISRSVLQKLTGKTPRTQRNYDAALAGKLRKRDNAKIVGKPRHGDEIPDGHYLDKVRTRDGDDYLVLLQRLPNSFMVGFERGRRGMMRKVNQRLRYSLQNVGRGKRKKLFYRDPVAAQRRIQQQRESDWFCIAGAEVGGRFVSETRGGARLWTGVQKVGGQVFFS